MYLYKDLDKRRKLVRKYLQSNPNATYIQIKNDTKIKIERVYPGGMKEAYRDAGVPFSKPLLERSKEERRKLVIDYIKKNPKATVTDIKRNLNIEIPKTFKTIENAYKSANIKYPKKPIFRHKEDKNRIKQKVVGYLKKNPLVTIEGLKKIFRINLYKYFKNLKEIYKLANIDYIEGHKKRSLSKQNEIISFIKNNPSATQKEINESCRTHVQEMFKEGIREAYKKAGIRYHISRLKIYGAAKSDIKNRARRFENEIIRLLSLLGEVKRNIKTKRGVIDALVNINNKGIVVEVKDYKAKPISYSDVKQLNRYLLDLNCDIGWLICHKKSKKDKFYIGNNKIQILTKNEVLSLIKGM